MPKMTLIHGDCLDILPNLKSKVDMVLTDPPYGITACKWDSVIPLELIWKQLKRLIKSSGAIVMTSSQPFTTTLIASNMKMYKYCWYWKKNKFTNHLNAKHQPMRSIEDVVVFYTKKPLFNRIPFRTGTHSNYSNGKGKHGRGNWGSHYKGDRSTDEIPIKAAIDFIEFNSVHPDSHEYCGHSTQKPVALMEYFIETYTNENEVVLDFAMGSGTTGVACKKLGRNFIGIEINKKYFDIAKDRLKNTKVDEIE